MKVKFLRLQMTDSAVKDYTDFLQNCGLPFTIEITNYTTRILSKNHNIYFIKNEQSNRAFAAASMLRRELSEHKPPNINMDKIEYYSTSLNNEFYSDFAYNIDIKSAYASILFNGGFISKKTYLYITRLPKQARLAALGMTASRKEIFVHNRKGEIIDVSETTNPLSPFFYYCVRETQNIILDLKNKIFQEMFLFSWVDGLYYLNDNDSYKNVAMKYLKEEYNLHSTFKKLTEFEVKIKKDFFKVTFKDDDKLKRFNIPCNESLLKRRIINHLLNKNYDSRN